MAENIVVRAQPHLERARIGLGRTINRTIDGSTQGPMETEGDEFSMSNNSHVGGWRNRRPPPQTNANFGIGTMSLTTTSLTVSATGIPDTVAASLTTPWERPTTTSHRVNLRTAGMSDSDEHISPEPPLAKHFKRRRPAPRHYRRDPVIEVPASHHDDDEPSTTKRRTRAVCDITHVWYRWGLLPPEQNHHYDTCTSPSDQTDDEEFASFCSSIDQVPLTPRTLDDLERHLPSLQSPPPAETLTIEHNDDKRVSWD